MEEATAILETRGFWSDIVAGVLYGTDIFELHFYGKANPEAVEIVRSVIDDKAPGLPLKTIENVTIITQTSEQWDDGMQSVEEILDLLQGNSSDNMIW